MKPVTIIIIIIIMVSFKIITETNSYRAKHLIKFAKELPAWEVQVKKMKSIFHTLNMLSVDITHKYLVGQCWCPVADLEVVKKSFKRIMDDRLESVISFEFSLFMTVIVIVTWLIDYQV